MTAQGYMLVHSRAKAGREAEYRDWYCNIHIGEVNAIQGFSAGQLYRCFGPDGAATGEFHAIYETDGQDPPALLGTLMAKRGEMNMSDAMDESAVKFTFLKPA